jgi:hypothetical protein
MKAYKCLVCDSNDCIIKEENTKVDVPFAEPIYYNTRVSHCNSCGASIRVDGEEQEAIELRVLESAVESIPELLKDLNRRGYSDSRLERAFDLGKGTISAWKDKKNVGPVEIALVRLVYCLPELIKITEDGYDIDKYVSKSFVSIASV